MASPETAESRDRARALSSRRVRYLPEALETVFVPASFRVVQSDLLAVFPEAQLDFVFAWWAWWFRESDPALVVLSGRRAPESAAALAVVLERKQRSRRRTRCMTEAPASLT